MRLAKSSEDAVATLAPMAPKVGTSAMHAATLNARKAT